MLFRIMPGRKGVEVKPRGETELYVSKLGAIAGVANCGCRLAIKRVKVVTRD